MYSNLIDTPLGEAILSNWFVPIWKVFFFFFFFFFPLRVDHYSEGAWCVGKQTEIHKVSTLVKMSESLPDVSSRLKHILHNNNTAAYLHGRVVHNTVLRVWR